MEDNRWVRLLLISSRFLTFVFVYDGMLIRGVLRLTYTAESSQSISPIMGPRTALRLYSWGKRIALVLD